MAHEELNDRAFEYRKKYGITQEQMVKILGMATGSTSNYSAFERGQGKLGKNRLKKLESVLLSPPPHTQESSTDDPLVLLENQLNAILSDIKSPHRTPEYKVARWNHFLELSWDYRTTFDVAVRSISFFKNTNK